MIPQSTIAGWVLFGYAVASLLWSPTSPWLAVVQLVSLAGAFWLGAQVKMIKYCALIALCLGIPFTIAWQVLGINPNIAGCFFVLFLAVALSFNKWLVAGVYGGLLGLTQSRGAILAGGLTLCLYGARKFPLVAAGALGAAVVLVAVIKPGLSESVLFRMGVWQDMINNMKPLGHGFGAFSDVFSHLPIRTNSGYFILYGGYNDFLQLWFELGIGVVPLIWLVAFAFEADSRVRLVLFAILACGLSYYPLFIPGLAHAFAFVLGHLQRSEYHGKMETYSRALPQRS